MRLLFLLLVVIVAVYYLPELAWAAAAGELPRPDWRDLVVALLGAVVGWVTRFLQQLATRRSPNGLRLPDDDRGR